ncbi:MAG TPA: glutathione S-transferase family protein [Polyangiaceae bacterium]|nr:glutathione S-transferase family protein [Polyangiaceae bacterium]
MSLTLYYHPLASFCHKVLIALYENGCDFRGEIVDLADPGSSAEMLSFWPVGKFPVLRDARRQRTVPETSIIIEYLAQHHAGPVPLLPADIDAALEVRLWDRFFDLYVQVPMQKVVVDRLRPADQHDSFGVEEARASLRKAYALAERQLQGRTWAAGEAFSLADCAAAPALFYAGIVEPFAPELPALAAYFERLLARPSVARTLREARPYFAMFPLRDAIPARFLEDAA